MKNRQKYLPIVLISAILLLVFVSIIPVPEAALPCFYVQHPCGTQAQSISIFDAENENFYVFLPSYADMAQVTVSLPGKERYALGISDLADGMNCAGFEKETPYPFSVNGQTVATLWFYQSANVATMYIDTATGKMDRIHEDKNHEEYASLQLYTPDGTLDFQDAHATIKGRGNATWSYDKRPYSLELSDDGNLLEMGGAANWVLLANACDETNLNNKLILDLASRVHFQWTPESRWVDLYLNGEYNGLYLLTEKIEVQENRLNICMDSGDFLCKIDLNRRWDTLQNPFLTKAGRTVEISAPEILAESEQAEIQRLVNQMEQAILFEKNLQNSAVIDLDSWVRRYLIDEIAGNIDADLASSYFYRQDGIFFAGPVWDYDMIFGNDDRNQESRSFIARNERKANELLSPYYSALYDNESFYARMLDIYRTEFLPVLRNMISYEIAAQSNFIHNASKSNSLRWRSMYDTLQSCSHDTVHTQEDLKEYLSQRIGFLNSVWLENQQYCTVQFESAGGAYWNISIPKGCHLETSHADFADTVWINAETGEVYDFSQPVMTDLILANPVKQRKALSVRDCIICLSTAVLLFLLSGFVFLDAVRRQKKAPQKRLRKKDHRQNR